MLTSELHQLLHHFTRSIDESFVRGLRAPRLDNSSARLLLKNRGTEESDVLDIHSEKEEKNGARKDEKPQRALTSHAEATLASLIV